MAGKKRGAKPAPRPRSGFVTEEQRGTERLNLRLPPLAADILQHVSEKFDANKNALVTLAILETFGAEFKEALPALERLRVEIYAGEHPSEES